MELIVRMTLNKSVQKPYRPLLGMVVEELWSMLLHVAVHVGEGAVLVLHNFKKDRYPSKTLGSSSLT